MRNLSNWLLPEWARPDHPLLQFERSHIRRQGGRTGFIVQLSLLSILLGGAAVVYAALVVRPAGAANLTSLIWQSIYYPALVLQLLTMIMALTLGASAVSGERNRKTWDNLRVTEFGAGLALRARWAGILYRIRAPITLILLVRLLLIAGILYDLTAFGGLYPEILGAQARPPLPEWRLELLLIALAVTLNILLPIMQIAAVAAFGILLSVAVRERIYALIIQMLVVALQLAFAAAGVLAISQMIQSDATSASDWSCALVYGYSAFGDWGLLLAQLGSLGEIWHRVPYGATISLGLMILVLGAGAGVRWHDVARWAPFREPRVEVPVMPRSNQNYTTLTDYLARLYQCRLYTRHGIAHPVTVYYPSAAQVHYVDSLLDPWLPEARRTGFRRLRLQLSA